LEYVQKDSYLEQIDEMNRFIEAVDSRFPADVPQELIIKTMKDIEDEIESLSIPSYTLGIPQILLSDGEVVDEETGVTMPREQLIRSSSSLNLEMTYADMKKLLAYIRNHENKLSIEGMQMSSNLASDTVSASFILDFFGLMSYDRELIDTDYFGPFEPKEDSIFNPFEEYGQNFDSGDNGESYVAEPDDFTIFLSSIYADRTTVILYDNNDTSQNSYIYADNPQAEPVEFIIDKEGDVFTYKYRTQGDAYPGDFGLGATFEPGEQIDIHVYSSEKVDENDNSGINLTINNNTDIPVDIKVDNDDRDNPRFNVESQIGNIRITR
jgi:type IV pilus assembly protein PilO